MAAELSPEEAARIAAEVEKHEKATRVAEGLKDAQRRREEGSK
jgi:hypothetical protein